MDLQVAATYRRVVDASSERVWENVRDWEHLPWLHASSFSRIELEDGGSWGWRSALGVRLSGDRIASSRLELVIDEGGEGSRYVSRTLEGTGAGSEIWTRVEPRTAHQTAIEVEFHLPEERPEALAKLGIRYTRLYRQLWDEDEAMMIGREAQLRRPRRLPRASRPGEEIRVSLGSVEGLRVRLPHRVEIAGRSFRIVERDGELVAHATTCPHLLGPLEESARRDGELVCPWHGYRYDLRSGRSCDGRNLRLETPPRVELDDDSGRVELVY